MDKTKPMEKLYPDSTVIVRSIIRMLTDVKGKKDNMIEIVTLPEGDYSTKKQIEAAMKKAEVKDFESYEIIRSDKTLRSGNITKEQHESL